MEINSSAKQCHTNRAKTTRQYRMRKSRTTTQAQSIQLSNDIVNNNNFHETSYVSTKIVIDKYIAVITF